MKTVAEILDDKGRSVWSVGPDDSVYRALEIMAEKGVGALVVLDGDRLAGILSERDYARKVILLGFASKDTPVRQIMSADVVTVAPDDTVQHCMGVMTERRIRHLPVMRGDDMAGVISIGDVVRAVIAEQENLIEQLERYITGGG